VPDGDSWLHELKFDGYRILSRIADGEAHLFSRNAKDWTARLSEVARVAARLPVRQAWLDGEVVVLMPDGNPSFQALQNAFDGRGDADISYYVFDLLYLDGYDLRPAPLLERKRLLSELLDTGKYEPLRYSDHVQGRGEQIYRQACRQGSEGIIAKRADGAYVAGRGRSWVKIKCGQRQEFVIAGYTDPSGSREAFGALLLGVYDKQGELRYAGRVGTGFNEQSLRQIHTKLRKREQAKPPFVDPPTGSEARGVHWVKPDLVAEVKFAEWTHEGSVRQASFQGLREDKPPRSITREKSAPQRAAMKHAKVKRQK
jgi:bifunctional non-homologous end joining protein LigD